MAGGRTIEIDILINDKTNGKIGGIQKELLAMEKAASRLANRIKALSTQKYMATLRLIDQVTDPASKVNNLLKKIAGKTWRASITLTDGALAGIRKIESALLRISGRAYNIAVNVKGAALDKLNGLMGGALMGAGMFAPMAGMMGVGYGVGNAISASASFEQQMSKVQAIRQLDKDSEEMRLLTQQAKDLGMQTAWTRQQVGEAQYYQALAGWETPQILKATPHMLNLASAGGMDLGAASDMLTDAMTAFGLKATDKYTNAKGKAIDLPEYFADMFAKVQASSNTDLYQLKEATKYSASTIGTMFSNIEGQEGVQARTEAARQMLVMAGLMANAGIKASMAGTGINTIFNRLAGENRNTHFAERLLGLEHAAENGNMLMPLDFIKAFRNKIQGGMSVEDFMTVAEELSGEKIHADTRRKINSTIENALKNGGKLGSSDMLKIGSMMAGLENAPKLMAMVFQDIEALEAKMNDVEGTAGQMAETMLDNLAGSFTKLGSAWDAFQQDLFTGTAGAGLRNFVDALTDVLTRANKLFQDGIDIPDFALILGDIITRLKNKFLEFDGIGSILAGGALVMGLKKIINLARSAMNLFKGITAAGMADVTGVTGAAGATGVAGKAGAALAGANVSTMNVKAGVVNLAGAVRGGYGYGGGGGRGGYGYGGGAAGAATSPMVAMLAAQKQFDKTNAQFLVAQAKRGAKWGKVEQLFAAGKSDSQLARARATARKFDETRYLPALERQQAAQKALVAARVNAYKEEISRQKQAVALAREEAAITRSTRMANIKSAARGTMAFAGIFAALDLMSLKTTNEERLAAAPEEQRAQIIRENRQAEWETGIGALGSVVGAGLGAALGSMVGPLGTMIGGVVGGVLGEKLGRWLGDKGAEEEVVPTPKVANVSQNQIEDIITGRKPGTDRGFDQFKELDRPKSGNWLVTPKEGQNYFSIGRDEGKAVDIIDWKKDKTHPTTPADWTPMPELNRGAGHQGWSYERSLEQTTKETEEFVAATQARQKAHYMKMDGMWKDNAMALDYYSQQAKAALGRIHHGGEQYGGGGDSFDTRSAPIAAPVTKPLESQGTTLEGNAITRALEVAAAAIMPSSIVDLLWSNKAHAAELNPEQQMQMAAMEGGTVASKVRAPFMTQGMGAAPEATEAPDLSAVTEQTFSDLEAFQESVNEMFSGFGEQITEQLTTAFESVGEVFSNFGTTLTEGLASTFEGVNEMFTNFGTTLTEGLTSTFEGAGEQFAQFGTMISDGFNSIVEGVGESVTALGTTISEGFNSIVEGASESVAMLGTTISEGLLTTFASAGEIFSGFNDMVSAGMTAVAATVTGVLSSIQATFIATKDSIQAAWGELPGFFAGVFSGLGGAAAAAGAAIYSGLTSVIGAVIGAWQSAAATVSSIIATISAAASSVAGMIPSIGGGIPAHAEGGFITSPEVALIGEKGAEAIIPLDGSQRALDLYKRTGEVLGVNQEVSRVFSVNQEVSGLSGVVQDVGGLPAAVVNKLPAHAEGGFITSPEVALIGEAGAEVVIPLDRSQRAKELFKKTGEILGLDSDGESFSITGNGGAQSSSNNSTVHINLGGISFEINSEQDIVQSVRNKLNDVAELVATQLSKTIANVRENQPLLT